MDCKVVGQMSINPNFTRNRMVTSVKACLQQSPWKLMLGARYYWPSMFNLTPERSKTARNKALGWFFICFAVLAAVLILPGAKESASPTLYVLIFGGLFVGIFAVLGIAILTGHVQW